MAGRASGFIAEGEVVVRVLVSASLHGAESLLLAEKRVPALQDVIDVLPTETPVYVAPQSVLDAIVGFPIHRGVLALGRRAPARSAAELLSGLGERAVVVGLIGVSNHDNVGGVFRNAAAFGVSAVLLDGSSCDPLYRKAIRVSTGSALRVPFARVATGAALVDALDDAAFEALALSPAGRETLADVRPAARTAVLLGAEGQGLPPAVLARCRTVRVPMAVGVDSLNVAVTAGIVLHHLAAAGSLAS